MTNQPNQGPPPGQRPGWGDGHQPGQPGPYGPGGPPPGWGGQSPPQQGMPQGAPAPGWGQQQHWGAPAGYAPPSGGGNKMLLWIVGLGGLVLAVVIALVLVFTLGGSASPKGTVESFINAAQVRNCAAAYALLSESLQKETPSCAEDEEELLIGPDEDVSFTGITVQSESDSAATVTAKAAISGAKRTIRFELVKEEGDWKIDSIADGPA